MIKIYKRQFRTHIEWRRKDNHKLHKENGPATVGICGSKEWFINGIRHRIDGPAIEYSDGGKEYWLNNECHRTDGPAVIWPNGDKEYWLYDERYKNIKTDEEWLIFQIIN